MDELAPEFVSIVQRRNYAIGEEERVADLVLSCRVPVGKALGVGDALFEAVGAEGAEEDG